MGFNLGAFLGGAASGGSQILDERRAQADRDKVTKEERQWQIATEERAAARTRKANRASKEKQASQLLEKLQFHYGDKAQAIANKGIGFAGEALARAGAYQDAGLNPALMVDIPTGKLTDVPAGQAGAVPSAMTFKPITEKDEKDHTTFQARLVAANEDLMKASTGPERVAAQEALDQINAAHQKFKQEAEGGDSGQLDFSKATRDAILQKPIDDILRENNLYTTDSITGAIKLKLQGNEAKILGLKARVIGTNSTAYVNVKDDPFQTKLQAQQAGLVADMAAYINKVKFNQDDPMLAGTGTTLYVPLAANENRTIEDVEKGFEAGQYKSNQVVQYRRADGKTGSVIVTPYGILGKAS
jgi:hypothetical protein